MAKIENLHINLLKRAKDNEEILDLLAISLFLKLKFTSSALHITSTRTICNHLHIGLDKFKKLQSSDLFDTMFYRTDGLFVARTLRKRGRQIQFSYGDGKASISIGKKKIYDKYSELKSYKDVKKLIRKAIVFINVFEQERITHSGMTHTGKASTSLEPKNGATPVFVGCSGRRMADKSGMSRTSVKKIIRECLNDGMIWKVNRRTVALSTRGMSDEEAFASVDKFMAGLDYEPGTYYYRSKSGRTVYQQRSNIYGTFLGMCDGMKFKRGGKSKIDTYARPNERLMVYGPDISEGIMSEDETVLPTGEVVKRPRVPLRAIDKAVKGGGKKLSKAERRRLRRYYAIKGSMSDYDMTVADMRIKEAMSKSWITPRQFISAVLKVIDQVLDYQRKYNRTCKRMGMPIATFSECYDFVCNDGLLGVKDKLEVSNLIGLEGIQKIYLQILTLPKGTILTKSLEQSLPGGS